MLHLSDYLIAALGILFLIKLVAGRFCEGGHICSLPRECCTQGCCPPYQSGPRQLPPASDHVLNLFFISHWYFWCVVVAIILAILCAYSLWKKRRTLCGWGLSDHHAQSEGDSAGSCYAPPQYSRCNSFHHPPPPYAEVTSKPDLYPLVFTCNNDNGKHGGSYLMVQYFRNYIVRPAGSLSATSTVDSLSSSFICNANEANTLVPPPYSRATSPEIGGFSSHFQQRYMIPRSASQLVCASGNLDGLGGNLASQQVYQPRHSQYSNPGTADGSVGTQEPIEATAATNYNNAQRSPVASAAVCGNSGSLFEADAANVDGVQADAQRTSGFVQSHSEQYFRYVANSNTSISDIFVNNSCTAELGGSSLSAEGAPGDQVAQTNSSGSHAAVGANNGGTPAIYSNGCIQMNPIVQKVGSSPKQLVEASSSAVYNSSSSIGGISSTVPVPSDDGNEYRDVNVLRRSLETCRQFLQQHQMPAGAGYSTDSPLRLLDFTKKHGDDGLRSYVTSGTCSAVSSLANIGTPSSPPQATSPTSEIKDILDQIRQLQTGGAIAAEESQPSHRPQSLYAMSTPSPTNSSRQFPADDQHGHLLRFPTMAEKQAAGAASPTSAMRSTHNSSAVNATTSSACATSNTQQTGARLSSIKRPSTLQQNKKKFFTPKPNKALYIPMMTNSTAALPFNRCTLKSPASSVVGANFFGGRGRARKGWISRSAPTTPATGMPPNRLGDDSPLLNEHDEDQEAEHNLE